MYEDRPLVCRLFGAVDHPNMKCPKGYGPAKLLPAAKEREILAFMAKADPDLI